MGRSFTQQQNDNVALSYRGYCIKKDGALWHVFSYVTKKQVMMGPSLESMKLWVDYQRDQDTMTRASQGQV